MAGPVEPVAHRGERIGSALATHDLVQKKQRQGPFPGVEIGAERLAGAFLTAEDIEKIVVDLVGDSQVPPERRRLGHTLPAGMPENGSQTTGHLKQHGRLSLDDAEVSLQPMPVPARLQRLLDLPRTDFAGRLRNQPADLRRRETTGHLQGLGKERVAEENSRGHPVLAGNRGGVVPQLGLVEDVVVHEGRQVDQLHDSRGPDHLFVEVALRVRSGQEQGDRSQALAAVPKGVVDEFAQLRLEIAAHRGEVLIQPAQEGSGSLEETKRRLRRIFPVLRSDQRHAIGTVDLVWGKASKALFSQEPGFTAGIAARSPGKSVGA